VTLRSCDGVLFCVHRKNLEVHSEAFAGGQAFSTQNEVVDLTETASVLDLLFHYIYPQVPPKLDDVDINLLIGLAEASRKYFFHAVIESCELQLKYVDPMTYELMLKRVGYDRNSISRFPFEVLQYASRHRRRELMDPAAERVLKMGISKFEGQPCDIPGWVRNRFLHTSSAQSPLVPLFQQLQPGHDRDIPAEETTPSQWKARCW
jgi:hypothetical protein